MARGYTTGVGAMVAGLALLGCTQQPSRPLDTGAINHEGLAAFEARNYDAAFIRPGVDFGAYRGLLVSELELAFRTPDRSQREFPLSEEQKRRFRDVLAEAFRAELSGLENLELVSDPAVDVLDLHIRVQDILAVVPGRSMGQMGRAAIALQAAGEATLVIELRDSRSEEILMRVFDQRAVEGAAVLKDGEPITRWDEVGALCREWARTAAAGIDRLVSSGDGS